MPRVYSRRNKECIRIKILHCSISLIRIYMFVLYTNAQFEFLICCAVFHCKNGCTISFQYTVAMNLFLVNILPQPMRKVRKLRYCLMGFI